MNAIKAVFFSLLLVPALAVAGTSFLHVDFSNLAKVLPWGEAAGALNYSGVALCADRDIIKPGERWFDVVVNLDGETAPLEGTMLRVKVAGAGPEKPVHEMSLPVVAGRALVRTDMRQPGMQKARIFVEWLSQSDEVLGTGEMPISAADANPLEPGTRIPVKIDLPEGAGTLDNYPVRFGLPLPEGAVWEAEGLKVIDAFGKELPSQLEAAGRWAEDGAVKWLWVDALVSGGAQDIYVAAGKRTESSMPSHPVKVDKRGDVFVIDTGAAQYTVGTDGALIKEARIGNLRVAGEGDLRGLYLIDQKGRLAKASAQDSSIKIEAEGPVSAVLRIEGFYSTAQGEALAGHITRLKFDAGRPEAQATHTLIITRDTNDVWFRDIGWEFEVAAGRNQQALFSLSQDNPNQVKSLPVSGAQAVSMLQKEGINLGIRPAAGKITFFRIVEPYMRGEEMFEITEAGGSQSLHEGGAMGDWAVLSGTGGGLMLSCRDAAAQHPKEFEVTASRMNFKMYSPAAGKELDFRMESLMKNWGLLPKEKITYSKEVPQEALESYLDFIARHSNNAVGWAKTHEILLMPFGQYASNLGNISLLHSKQVFAHVDPQWIRQTRVLMPLHPVDKKRFPVEEALIEKMFWGEVKKGYGGAAGGFIDYHAGPHFLIHDWRGGGYTIRSVNWYLYARSADRSLRELAQGTSRVFLDGNISHWGSPDKILGLPLNNTITPGTQQSRTRPADLPMYWAGYSSDLELGLSTMVNFDQALFDYYITGYRRAGDIMGNYAFAVKENLTEETTHYRVIKAIGFIAQAYGATWEPRLRELIYQLTDKYIYDPESPVLLTKARPHRTSTYKMDTDGDYFVQVYELLGDRLFYNMAKSIAKHNWDTKAVIPPLFGQNRSTGFLGHFLWEQTGDPSVAARFDYARRKLVAKVYNEKTGQVTLRSTPLIPKYLQGLPLAMDVLILAEGQEQKPSSWIAFNVNTPSVKLFFFKPGETTTAGMRHSAPLQEGETSLNLLVRKESSISGSVEHYRGRMEDGIVKPWATGCSVLLKPHTVLRYIWMGHDLHTITEKSSGTVHVNIPKDAPGGVYELELKEGGHYSVFTDKNIPLALYAPDGWTPAKLNPPVRTYFRVPEETEGKAQKIFFQSGAVLFTPDGQVFNEGEKVSGWVELPRGKPGLWSFEGIDPGMVRTEDLPGFFAMGSPGFYMEHK